jgi:lipoyl-dependent peroxiredoxin
MPVRTSKAKWNGTLQKGNGTLMLGSGAFEGNYSFGSRFEEAPGTNPEELIGAAHAGCFSMALSEQLEKAGFPSETVFTTSKVHLDKADGGFKISGIDLATEVKAPGISQEVFAEQAEIAKENCPVSQALKSVPVTLTVRLVD